MYILQVNSVKNIGVKFEERQKGKLARGPRTLLFELTDGRQTVTAMEFESLAISDVDQIRYGMKVAVCDILIRRGILLLRPCNFEVLGGAVETTQVPANDVIDLSATAGDGYADERRISY
jgi:RecQ-mediated genome instability protein 1